MENKSLNLAFLDHVFSTYRSEIYYDENRSACTKITRESTVHFKNDAAKSLFELTCYEILKSKAFYLKENFFLQGLQRRLQVYDLEGFMKIFLFRYDTEDRKTLKECSESIEFINHISQTNNSAHKVSMEGIRQKEAVIVRILRERKEVILPFVNLV